MPQFELQFKPLLQTDTGVDSSSKTFSVPANKTWKIKSIYCAFTSNATVGNRQLAVEVLSGATVVARAVAGAVQAASVTRQYLFSPHNADLTSFRDTTFLSTPLSELTIPQNLTIKVYDKAAIAATGSGENLLVYMLVEQYG